ncbi:MAG: hypothetical protein R2713_04200 [Ilumatobacteraceae bacterium]
MEHEHVDGAQVPVEPSASVHPPTWTFDFPIYHAVSRAQWRTWLVAYHATARGVWLCSWRRADRPRCPYPDAVEGALCFGWIDSTASVLDDDRGLQLMTAQAEEQLDPSQPTPRRRHGGSRADDRRGSTSWRQRRRVAGGRSTTPSRT